MDRNPSPVRFPLHSTSASWLNAVESFLAKLTKKRLKRGVFRSLQELKDAIHGFLDDTNANLKPFTWTKDPNNHRRRQARAPNVMEWIGRAPGTLASLLGWQISLKRRSTDMATVAINDIVTTIRVDLGKNVFHIVGMNARGAIVLKERLSRAKLARRLTNMTSCLIGMEACAGAHHVGRQLAALGHDLIATKHVRPFLKGHKSDYRDAEAIAEVVQRPTMRFVALER